LPGKDGGDTVHFPPDDDATNGVLPPALDPMIAPTALHVPDATQSTDDSSAPSGHAPEEERTALQAVPKPLITKAAWLKASPSYVPTMTHPELRQDIEASCTSNTFPADSTGAVAARHVSPDRETIKPSSTPDSSMYCPMLVQDEPAHDIDAS